MDARASAGILQPPMSELQELRQLQIGMENAEGFFIDLEELLAKYLE